MFIYLRKRISVFKIKDSLIKMKTSCARNVMKMGKLFHVCKNTLNRFPSVAILNFAKRICFNYVVSSKSSLNSGIIFGERTRNGTSLAPLKCRPSAHALAVLPLFETPVEVLFRYGSCCRFLLNFLHGRKTMNFVPCIESREEAEVAQSEVWRIWWLGDGWN
jgi:hypothetical protein